ncbi:MAG: hypothetical protein EXS39_04685, partial [Opitutaceae bacterium]|nr:hypothetical protein [Opitutaceae bacterium]
GIAESLYREGAIHTKYAGLSLNDRLVAICVESGRNFPQHFDFSLPQKDLRRDTPIHVGPAVFRTLTSPRLLDLVEDLVGPEIYSNPVQHIRFKVPPRAVQRGVSSVLVVKTPWHQDNGVILPEADEATILTVWLPLTPATIENGCLQVVPRSHRRGLADHCPSSFGLTIPDRLIAVQDALPLPMRPGSVLLMTQRTVHGSLENETTDDVRISMDLRYQPPGRTPSCAIRPCGLRAGSRCASGWPTTHRCSTAGGLTRRHAPESIWGRLQRNPSGSGSAGRAGKCAWNDFRLGLLSVLLERRKRLISGGRQG